MRGLCPVSGLKGAGLGLKRAILGRNWQFSGRLWPHRGRVGSDTFMASRTHLWPSRTPKNLPWPFGPRFLQHISKNFCRAGQFYNAMLFFCRYEAITVLAQSDFTLILLNKHGLVGFSRTVGQIVSEPGNESDSSALENTTSHPICQYRTSAFGLGPIL